MTPVVLTTTRAVRAIYAIAISDILLQSVPSPGDVMMLVKELGGMSLSAVLLIAVWWLVRELKGRDSQIKAKDQVLMGFTEKVTQALLLNAETNREVRKALDDDIEAKRDLTASITSLKEHCSATSKVR